MRNSLISCLCSSKFLHKILIKIIFHFFNRYRERIKMKYPVNINTKNWKFVKDGLDDFRDGLPPSHDNIILEVSFCSILMIFHFYK